MVYLKLGILVFAHAALAGITIPCEHVGFCVVKAVVRAALISNLSDNKVQVAASPVEWALTRGFCEVEGPTKIQIKGESSFSRQ